MFILLVELNNIIKHNILSTKQINILLFFMKFYFQKIFSKKISQ
jgi:hypothetical protein